MTGAGLLAGLGLPTAPAALRDIGCEAALALVRTLLARLARSSPAPSDARCGDRSGAHAGYEAPILSVQRAAMAKCAAALVAGVRPCRAARACAAAT